MINPIESRPDAYASFRHRDFRYLWIGRFLATLGEQMVGTAIGWELYLRTQDPLALGLVGLAQVLPVILFSVFAGSIADRYNRKRIIQWSQSLLIVSAAALTYLSATRGSLELIYGMLFLIGVGRAFKEPASSTLLASTVSEKDFGNAATWSSTAWQFSAVIGPALGGLLIAILKSATFVFALDVIAGIAFLFMVTLIRGRTIAYSSEKISWSSILDGFRFIRDNKIILAAITLDMLAVLLGGATALLPVYAEEILNVGAVGLGTLRAAPSVGALAMALYLANRPPFQRSGLALLWAVVGFGAATIVFGLSTNFILSLLMLVLLGAFDNISVVIRSTLLLVRVPDVMRGRISAVNNIFIGMSNELGQFESGAAAALLTTVPAVVFGGVGTIVIVAWIAYAFPALRRMGLLIEPKPIESAAD